MRPKRLGEKSLVIACSHSGNTPEVIDACSIAKAAGATVIVQTDNAGSGIDNGEWTCWVYPWGEEFRRRRCPPASLWLSLPSSWISGRLCRPCRHVRRHRQDGPDPACSSREGQRRTLRPFCRPVPGPQVPVYLGVRSRV
ncbi:MAG: SIS domain-containing protein [Collinsella sp.]